MQKPRPDLAPQTAAADDDEKDDEGGTGLTLAQGAEEIRPSAD
jgi:hypothetical protein